MVLRLGELAAAAGGELRGDPALEVSGVATLQAARPGQVSFLGNPRYRKHLVRTRATAVILGREDAEACPVAALVSANPQLAYARVAALFVRDEPAPRGAHPSAVISPRARVAHDAWIGPHCTIEGGAVVASGAFVGPGCVIGRDARVGEGCRLLARVTVCHGVVLGRRVVVYPGAVIGGEGFGMANDSGRWVHVPQLGSVRVGDDVEIGCNTTIDRGAIEDTVIEDGVKLDNLIQIAHNVQVGSHTAMAGCVGIAGSARIGRHCTLGGGVGVAGHLEIADHVHVTGMSLVARSITEPGVYSSGLAVEPNRLWNRISARLRQLDQMARRLAALEGRKRSGPATRDDDNDRQ